LPSGKMLLLKDIYSYLPLKSQWIKKEIGSVIGVLVLLFLVDSWKDIYDIGVVIYFKELSSFLLVALLFIILALGLIHHTNKTNAAG